MDASPEEIALALRRLEKQRATMRAYYERHREERRAKQREYYAANRDARCAANREAYARKRAPYIGAVNQDITATIDAPPTTAPLS